MPSLREYLLIAQREKRVEHYVRQSVEEWLLCEVTNGEGLIDLPSIGCALAMADLYDKVTVPAHPPILREAYVEHAA